MRSPWREPSSRTSSKETLQFEWPVSGCRAFEEQGLLTFMVCTSACLCMPLLCTSHASLAGQAHARHGHSAVRLLLQAPRHVLHERCAWVMSQLLGQLEALDGPDLARARELLCAELPSLKVSRPGCKDFLIAFAPRNARAEGMAGSSPAGLMQRAESRVQPEPLCALVLCHLSVHLQPGAGNMLLPSARPPAGPPEATCTEAFQRLELGAATRELPKPCAVFSLHA